MNQNLYVGDSCSASREEILIKRSGESLWRQEPWMEMGSDSCSRPETWTKSGGDCCYGLEAGKGIGTITMTAGSKLVPLLLDGWCWVVRLGACPSLCFLVGCSFCQGFFTIKKKNWGVTFAFASHLPLRHTCFSRLWATRNRRGTGYYSSSCMLVSTLWRHVTHSSHMTTDLGVIVRLWLVDCFMTHDCDVIRCNDFRTWLRLWVMGFTYISKN